MTGLLSSKIWKYCSVAFSRNGELHGCCFFFLKKKKKYTEIGWIISRPEEHQSQCKCQQKAMRNTQVWNEPSCWSQCATDHDDTSHFYKKIINQTVLFSLMCHPHSSWNSKLFHGHQCLDCVAKSVAFCYISAQGHPLWLQSCLVSLRGRYACLSQRLKSTLVMKSLRLIKEFADDQMPAILLHWHQLVPSHV